MLSERPKPPPLPGGHQPEADAGRAGMVKLPPTPLRPGTTSPTATLAAVSEQTGGNGASPAKPRLRPGPPPLPRSAIPERRTTNIPPGLEPRPAAPLPPQQVRTNGHASGPPGPDFSKLPPSIAASLAKLAGRGNAAPRNGGDPPTSPATADTADTGGKPPHNT